MESPKRPITIWICVFLLGIMGLLGLFPLAYALFMDYVIGGPFVNIGRTARSSLFVPASIAFLFSITPIIMRRNWGRWLAVLSAFIFLLTFLGIFIYIIQSDGSPVSISRSFPDLIGDLLVLSIPVTPLIFVVTLLFLGKRSRDYFSVTRPERESAPPPPPVFQAQD